MDYNEIPDFDKDSLSNLNSVDSNIVMLTILSIVTKSGNYNLAVKVTRRFIDHHNEFIRGAAVESVSHIARLWKKIPVDLIDQIHKMPFQDSSSWVRNKLGDTINDLVIFIQDYKRPMT